MAEETTNNVTPDPDTTEELRLALVMNGGVSLAVWMGGVTNEIFRLIKVSHPAYFQLLELTRTTVKVDVISGTSAGGINGAALAIALIYGGEFKNLRDVWLEIGDLDALLRPPIGANPGSLLMGDAYFLPSIRNAFSRLAVCDAPEKTPEELPLDLQLTTTLLSGRQNQSVDDLGTPMHDVDYRARFSFTRSGSNGKGAHDDFGTKADMLAALSLAARSTASFPFAFEPSAIKGTLPAGRLVDSFGNELKGADAIAGTMSKASATTSPFLTRHVVDGGVLDNKPIRGALRAIFKAPRDRSVRRVLAYINPDPGDGPPAQLTSETPLPELGPVLSASLFTIPQSQTIADQLQELSEHNHRVRTRRDSVMNVVCSLKGESGKSLAHSLFGVYRKRRLANAFENFVFDNLVAAASKNPLLAPALAQLGKNRRADMRVLFDECDWSGWLPETWPGTANEDTCSATTWQWGLFPVEFAVRVLLQLLRATQSLEELAQSYARSPRRKSVCPTVVVMSGDWADPDFPHASTVQQMLTSDASKLRALWSQAFEMVSKIANRREADASNWMEQSVQLLKAQLRKQKDNAPLVRPCEAKDFVDMFSFLSSKDRRVECGALAFEVARCVKIVDAVGRGVIRSLLTQPLSRAQRLECDALTDFLDFLTTPVAEDCDVVYRLLQLEVIEYSFNDRDPMDEDALIDLIQISGNSKSPLSERCEAKTKLLGLQVAHFGAFYKRSWRANDWTFGRLDGSERLVKMLLNPARLRLLHQAHEPSNAQGPSGGTCSTPRAAVHVTSLIKDIAVNTVAPTSLKETLAMKWTDGGFDTKIAAELAFLDDHDAPLPDMLPFCAEAITTRLHFGILREELPELGSAIMWDQAHGADGVGPGQTLLRELAFDPGRSTSTGKTASSQSPVPPVSFTPEQAKKALENGLVTAESLTHEAGSDLFTRTIVHALAAAQSTLGSKTSGLGPISLLCASLRVPILGLFYVAAGLTRQSRTSAALNGGILCAGVIIIALQLITSPGSDSSSFPHIIVTFGWALFAYGVFMTMLSAPILTVFGSLVIVIVGGFVAWPTHSSFVAALCLVALLVLLGKRIPVLQWVSGIAFIILAAVWTSVASRGTSLRLADLVHEPIILISYVVALTVVLAMLQAARWLTRMDQYIRQTRATKKAAQRCASESLRREQARADLDRLLADHGDKAGDSPTTSKSSIT